MEGKIEPSISALIERLNLAIAEDDVELCELRQELEARNVELSKLRFEIANSSELAKNAELANLEMQQEIELTLSQLHDAQKELEHYFLLCQKQSELLKAGAKLQARSMSLLASINT